MCMCMCMCDDAPAFRCCSSMRSKTMNVATPRSYLRCNKKHEMFSKRSRKSGAQTDQQFDALLRRVGGVDHNVVQGGRRRRRSDVVLQRGRDVSFSRATSRAALWRRCRPDRPVGRQCPATALAASPCRGRATLCSWSTQPARSKCESVSSSSSSSSCLRARAKLGASGALVGERSGQRLAQRARARWSTAAGVSALLALTCSVCSSCASSS